MTLNIYETFASIQGESTRAGVLCFFIRLAQCNLRCSYCDTKRAQTLQNSRPMSVEQLVEQADLSGIDLVEITGGEPMVQTEGVCELAKQLIKHGHTVMIETNGSLDLAPLPPEVIRIVDEVIRRKAPLCGLSALMTTTVPAMEETIRQLREKAPWCRVMVGGAVLTAEYAAEIHADFYSRDAMGAVRTAEEVFA